MSRHLCSSCSFSRVNWSSGYFSSGKSATGQSGCGKSNLWAHFVWVSAKAPVITTIRVASAEFLPAEFRHHDSDEKRTIPTQFIL